MAEGLQDIDEIVVNYPSMFELVADLKDMGENNAVWFMNMMRPCHIVQTFTRSTFLSNDTLVAAAAAYQGWCRCHSSSLENRAKALTA